MLKSLFLKQKGKTNELLPPPPPFPRMEIEEPSPGPLPNYQFENLFEETEIESPEKLSNKKSKKPSKVKEKLKPKEEFYDFGKDLDFRTDMEPEFRDLEELGIDNLKAEEGVMPQDLEEAEDEIANAIKGVKKEGKKSFFGSLFKKQSMPAQGARPEIEVNDLDAVKKRINNARNAIMYLDLESAKNEYIEIMRLYNKLMPEEQAQVYLEIRDLYYERKGAEELNI